MHPPHPLSPALRMSLSRQVAAMESARPPSSAGGVIGRPGGNPPQ